MKRKKYKEELYDLQIELVKFQKEVIEKELQVCVIFEGRDSAGKDGIIKRFLTTFCSNYFIYFQAIFSS
jgi:polyphosphate kinase